MLHRASNYLLGTCLDAGRAAALALLDFWFPGLVPHLRRDFGRAASFSGSKKPLKPLGFQGFVWWTIQDSKREFYLSL